MKIEDLIASSSIGEGLSWSVFGTHLRGRRLYFRIKIALLSRMTNISVGRISEIEAGGPPFATFREVKAIAEALGVNAEALEALAPR